MNKSKSITALLTNDQMLKMYRSMVILRTLDQRLWAMNRQGKAAIMASSQGHEAAQIASVEALQKGKDKFYTYYRDLGVMLSLGMTPTEIMLGFLAKAGEPLSGARQFPTHGAYPKLGLINLSNVVGTQITQAVGASLAAEMRGEDSVTITYFGDGATSQGECHEAMNFAGIHQLPIIFFCENNKYATSIPLKKQMAAKNVAERAAGYGILGKSIDGCDISSVFSTVQEAAHRARSGLGPTLIDAQVERFLPHTSDDDDTRYRTREELEISYKRDPIVLLRNQLEANTTLTSKIQSDIEKEAKLIINEATQNAEAAPYVETSEFNNHVYSTN
ncbi:MAG: 2-oxoisovalerate dehydrogenase [Chloroflexi bacterium]|nr:2-oxoisovalerate dehydrogenase [Chloroflexota bacterium]|tara:strand:+ start:109707 stop:110702 length:996 start_codon:yes stop_codon:yes gene_type:complete